MFLSRYNKVQTCLKKNPDSSSSRELIIDQLAGFLVVEPVHLGFKLEQGDESLRIK
jgi:hypothetical protein